MSIINSDGLNTNWQLNVLRGLQGIIDELNGSTNVNATIVSPLGARPEIESVSVALSTTQWALPVRPALILSAGDVPTLIVSQVYSISFASNGTAPALVSFDGGSSYLPIPPGTTINMDANGLGNYYQPNTFGYDTQAAGSSLIITWNE
jgi:hypothetical protein